MDTPYLLVVDDNPGVCQLISDSLRDEGYQVVQAYNGEEALAQASKTTPALVISDINMPGMTGLELLDKIKSQFPFLPMENKFLKWINKHSM